MLRKVSEPKRGRVADEQPRTRSCKTRLRNQVGHTKRSRLTVQQLAEDFVFRTNFVCLLTGRAS